MANNKRIAVILFNLGGPDKPEAVKPFLFNLFNDKAIIGAPNPIRFMLAKLISSRREKTAQEIYSHIGGKSPILELTGKQAEALEKKLKPEGDYKVFVSMRYWHPFSKEVAAKVKQYSPDEILLLPLYPQFSTTTSGSSLNDWKKQAKKAGIKAKTKTICCYFSDDKFINAHVEEILPVYEEAKKYGNPRILFSAHGLPKKIIEKGDPYQYQVEKTAAAIAEKMLPENPDWKVCYQSRVGPLEWIGPSTDGEIIAAAEKNIPLVIVPIAFVSEHSETLVELDIEYRNLAKENGLLNYFRVPALGSKKGFVEALAGICLTMTKGEEGVCSFNGKRNCPAEFSGCPLKTMEVQT